MHKTIIIKVNTNMGDRLVIGLEENQITKVQALATDIIALLVLLRYSSGKGSAIELLEYFLDELGAINTFLITRTAGIRFTKITPQDPTETEIIVG